MSYATQLRELRELSVRVRARDRRGRCYELSAKGQLRDPSWTLVHGWKLTLAYDGPCHIQHAWLERDGQIYDPAMDMLFESADDHGGIAVRRFNAQDTALSLAVSGVYAPWHREAAP
jgi:hypothetical protein